MDFYEVPSHGQRKSCEGVHSQKVTATSAFPALWNIAKEYISLKSLCQVGLSHYQKLVAINTREMS